MGRPSLTQRASAPCILSKASTLLGTPQASLFANGNLKGDSEEASPVVPPTHPSRTLILCFDGTMDQFDDDNSNVVQFHTMLKKDDSEQQVVYYQTGFGTITSPSLISHFTTKLSRHVDAAIASNLSRHVMQGYKFIMQNCTSYISLVIPFHRSFSR
jgi:hypothetical protein